MGMPDCSPASIAEMMCTIYKFVKDNGRKERSIVTASKGSLDLIVSPLDPEEDNLWQVVQNMSAINTTINGLICIFNGLIL